MDVVYLVKCRSIVLICHSIVLENLLNLVSLQNGSIRTLPYYGVLILLDSRAHCCEIVMVVEICETS